MYSVDHIQIKYGDAVYSCSDDVCRHSKNLYNAALFVIRNNFTAQKKDILTPNEQYVHDEISLLHADVGAVISYNQLERLMRVTNNPDFFAGLPMQTAQQTVRQAVQDFRNWLKSLKEYKRNPSRFKAKPRMPHYKKSPVAGAVFTNQDAVIRNRWLKLPKTDIKIRVPKRNHARLKEVKLVPFAGTYELLLCYESDSKPARKHLPGKAAIDFGVDNLIAITADNGASAIIKGGAMKEHNQWFNKRRAFLISEYTKGHPSVKHPSTKALDQLSLNRRNFLSDSFHKAAVFVKDFCLANHVGTLYLGVNKGWKQDINIGHRNNQMFVQMPIYKLRFMITYVCKRAGINVIEYEESYTSKASFLDSDFIPTYGVNDGTASFSGKRIHRGLYKSKDGSVMNADLNAAANILRKSSGQNAPDITLKTLQEPLVIRYKDLCKRIPFKRTEAA